MFAKLFIAFLKKYGNNSVFEDYDNCGYSDGSDGVTYHIDREYHCFAVRLEYHVEPNAEWAYIDIAFRGKNYTLYLKNWESELNKRMRERFYAEQYF